MTVNEVWIPSLKSAQILMILLLHLLLSFCFDLNDISNTQIQCFIGQPNNKRFNFVQNTPLHIVFLTLFLVYGYPDETLSCLIYHINNLAKIQVCCVSFTCYSVKCLSQIYTALYEDAMVIKYNRYICAICAIETKSYYSRALEY